MADNPQNGIHVRIPVRLEDGRPAFVNVGINNKNGLAGMLKTKQLPEPLKQMALATVLNHRPIPADDRVEMVAVVVGDQDLPVATKAMALKALAQALPSGAVHIVRGICEAAISEETAPETISANLEVLEQYRRGGWLRDILIDKELAGKRGQVIDLVLGADSLQSRFELAEVAVMDNHVELSLKQKIMESLEQVAPEEAAKIIDGIKDMVMHAKVPVAVRVEFFTLLQEISDAADDAKNELITTVKGGNDEMQRKTAVAVLLKSCDDAKEIISDIVNPLWADPEVAKFWNAMGLPMPSLEDAKAWKQSVEELFRDIVLDAKYDVKVRAQLVELLNGDKKIVIRELEDIVDEKECTVHARESALAVLLSHSETQTMKRLLEIGSDSDESHRLVCRTVAGLCARNNTISTRLKQLLRTQILGELDVDGRYQRMVAKAVREKPARTVKVAGTPILKTVTTRT